MTYGGLFEGIGGFALAAREVGITPIWSNEIDSYCCQVLRKNFNHQIIEGDIRNVGKGRKYELESVDIICGGFPCQPFSVAGKRKGRGDNRYLWPEMLRIIREINPSWIIGENVPGILNMEEGLVFEEICTSLEREGYKVQPFSIEASAASAFHRRERIWIIANNNNNTKRRVARKNARKSPRKWLQKQHEIQYTNKRAFIPCDSNPNSKRLPLRNEPESLRKKNGGETRTGGQLIRMDPEIPWWEWEIKPILWGGDDGVPNRVDRIKALGNAIHPGLASKIFKIILEYEHTKN